MTKQKIKTAVSVFFVTAMLLIAYSCRIVGNNGYYGTQVGLLRSFIFIALFSVWGASLYSRIIQTRIRCYMSAIVLLMILWFIIRTMKFYFISEQLYPDVVRHLWYLYYLSILFIPLMSVLVAMSIGKTEDSHLPNYEKIVLSLDTGLESSYEGIQSINVIGLFRKEKCEYEKPHDCKW